MAAKRLLVQRDNLCIAAETTRTGKRVVVYMVDPIITAKTLPVFAQSWNTPPANLVTPMLLDGLMCPASFSAHGFGFDVYFDVGVVRKSVRGRETDAFGITKLTLGTGNDHGRGTDIDSKQIFPKQLLRLALQASACVAVAYPAGWTVDMTTGEHIATLKSNDELIGNTITYGITTKKLSRTKRVSSRDPLTSGLTYDVECRAVEYLTGTEVVLQSVGRQINHAELNNLVGNISRGKGVDGSMSDPKILKLVAKLYANELPIGQRSRVEYVVKQLQAHSIYKSASWVRQVAVAARKSGDLKQGKRK